MTAIPRTRFEMFVEMMFDRRSPDARRHRLRAYVLEQATILELGINEVLSASIASGLDAGYVLESEVFWRLPIPVRLGLLADLLERRDLQDHWPFVVPVLRQFFDVRHKLAHGLTHSLGPTGQGVELTIVKQGKLVTMTYQQEYLDWLAWQAHVTSLELIHIWAAVVPATRAWREVHTRDVTG